MPCARQGWGSCQSVVRVGVWLRLWCTVCSESQEQVWRLVVMDGTAGGEAEAEGGQE